MRSKLSPLDDWISNGKTYDILGSAVGLKSTSTPQIVFHWCHSLKSPSDLRVFSNRRSFQILRSMADVLLSNQCPFQSEDLFVLLPCHMMDVGHVKLTRHLYCISYQMNVQRQSCRHKFSAPDRVSSTKKLINITVLSVCPSFNSFSNFFCPRLGFYSFAFVRHIRPECFYIWVFPDSFFLFFFTLKSLIWESGIVGFLSLFQTPVLTGVTSFETYTSEASSDVNLRK